MMAKTKNKKRISADRIHSKREKSSAKKLVNPFEVHVNKEKLRVLGKKQKNDRGLPGISRAKAIEKRKHTLLQEYKVLNKSNKFTDRRIGEKSHNMTAEDKATARFTAVRTKVHNKKNIFNLGEDEVLTHRGQTLSEIEKFEDPRSEDEESLDEDNTGKLDKKFVEDAHFGGGILKNTGTEGAKTHRELIDQLIAESKKRKAEKQKTKEATLELTEKLDSEWKDLLPVVSKSKKNEDDQMKQPKIDDYDKIMRELRFEARGTVSDRLKTEDEIAKEEKEKLEQLERERLERMKGFVEEKPSATNHRSADDLDDDFVYESDNEYMLSYNKEGESNVDVKAEINGKNVSNNAENSNEGGMIEEVEGEDASDEELETDSEDNLSDLKEDSGTSEDETEEAKEADTSESNQTKAEIDDSEETEAVSLQEITNKVTNIETDLQGEMKNESLKQKEIMEGARKELPYTFVLPDSYETLYKTFENQSSNYQSVIIERMIKCNHPSIAEGNKEGLGLLFAYLLQYINDLFTEVSDTNSIKKSFDILKALIPQIYDLASFNSENAHNSVLEVIKEKHEEFRKKRRVYPSLEVLIFLKLVNLLFSTSDFRHQVVTPCFVFMEQMLNKCRVRNKCDISYGLFLATLVCEYTALSKRYLPAVINFLSGILHMAIPKSGVKLVKVVRPFRATSSLLVLVENYSLENLKAYQMDSIDLLGNEIEEEYKVRVLYNTIKLLQEFCNNFQELSSSIEVFEPVLKYLQLIPPKNYPKEVQHLREDFLTALNKRKSERKLNYIVREAQKPKALRLYEPKIEEVYEGRRFKVQSKEKAERNKMLHKLKRETKGALREIRRDKAFLGRVKIQQRLQSDKERKEKVKRLYAEASMQQSELNQLDRKKKRRT